jgi:hypothetical protein
MGLRSTRRTHWKQHRVHWLSGKEGIALAPWYSMLTPCRKALLKQAGRDGLVSVMLVACQTPSSWLRGQKQMP